jgi:hypothetical protein
VLERRVVRQFRLRSAIENYVNLLNSNGLVAILDLHWTDGTYTGSSSGCFLFGSFWCDVLTQISGGVIPKALQSGMFYQW